MTSKNKTKSQIKMRNVAPMAAFAMLAGNQALNTMRMMPGFGGFSLKQVSGARSRHPGGYMPAGPHCNVSGTVVRNPKVAAQVNAMHATWAQGRV